MKKLIIITLVLLLSACNQVCEVTFIDKEIFNFSHLCLDGVERFEVEYSFSKAKLIFKDGMWNDFIDDLSAIDYSEDFKKFNKASIDGNLYLEPISLSIVYEDGLEFEFDRFIEKTMNQEDIQAIGFEYRMKRNGSIVDEKNYYASEDVIGDSLIRLLENISFTPLKYENDIFTIETQRENVNVLNSYTWLNSEESVNAYIDNFKDFGFDLYQSGKKDENIYIGGVEFCHELILRDQMGNEFIEYYARANNDAYDFPDFKGAYLYYLERMERNIDEAYITFDDVNLIYSADLLPYGFYIEGPNSYRIIFMNSDGTFDFAESGEGSIYSDYDSKEYYYIYPSTLSYYVAKKNDKDTIIGIYYDNGIYTVDDFYQYRIDNVIKFSDVIDDFSEFKTIDNFSSLFALEDTQLKDDKGASVSFVLYYLDNIKAINIASPYDDIRMMTELFLNNSYYAIGDILTYYAVVLQENKNSIVNSIELFSNDYIDKDISCFDYYQGDLLSFEEIKKSIDTNIPLIIGLEAYMISENKNIVVALGYDEENILIFDPIQKTYHKVKYQKTNIETVYQLKL